MPEIHDQKGEIVENIRDSKRLVELDCIEENGRTIDQGDIAQMKVAMAAPHLAFAAAPQKQRLSPIEGRDQPRPKRTGVLRRKNLRLLAKLIRRRDEGAPQRRRRGLPIANRRPPMRGAHGRWQAAR